MSEGRIRPERGMAVKIEIGKGTYSCATTSENARTLCCPLLFCEVPASFFITVP